MEKIINLKTWIKKHIIERIMNRLYDYFYKVPRTAGICFAYYIIIAIVPMCSLFAFFAQIFNVDLNVLRKPLETFLTPEYSQIIVNSLLHTKINMLSFVILGMSIYVVSRGINQIYSISKNLFPTDHQRNAIMEIVMSIIKTITVFIIIIFMIASVTFFPIINNFVDLGNDFLYLFVIFTILMALLYKIIPDCHIHPVDIFKGAIATSFILVTLIKILEFYFSHANYTSVYGPLASVVIILMSLTFVAEVIYVGMYIMFEAHMKRLIIMMQAQLTPRPTARERLLDLINRRKKDIQADLIKEPQDSIVIDEEFYQKK